MKVKGICAFFWPSNISLCFPWAGSWGQWAGGLQSTPAALEIDTAARPALEGPQRKFSPALHSACWVSCSAQSASSKSCEDQFLQGSIDF